MAGISVRRAGTAFAIFVAAMFGTIAVAPPGDAASDGRSYVTGYFAMDLDSVCTGLIQIFEGGDIESPEPNGKAMLLRIDGGDIVEPNLATAVNGKSMRLWIDGVPVKDILVDLDGHFASSTTGINLQEGDHLAELTGPVSMIPLLKGQFFISSSCSDTKTSVQLR